MRVQGFILAILAVLWASFPSLADEPAGRWPQFRGAGARGLGSGDPPTKWDVTTGENLLWKTPIPGLGLSSPVIWGERIFVTTAVGPDDQDLKVGLYGDISPVNEDKVYSFRLLCLNRATGKVEWSVEAHRGVPKIKRHQKASHANSTPATDGEHVLAFFGSEGLFCYDMSGKLEWQRDFGVLDSGYYVVPQAQWGFGSSPVIHDGRVYLQCDVQKDPFIACLDLKDGRELWRTPRNEVPTWSTPALHSEGGTTQMICNGYRQIAGYDADTGKRLWEFEGLGDIPVPSPVVADGLVFFTSAHGQGRPIYAVRTNVRGDVEVPGAGQSNKQVAWWTSARGNYMQTPLIVGELAYFCFDNGVLTCFRAATGQKVYNERLGGGQTGFTASGVAAGGHLYFTSEEGDVYAVKAGEKFELVSRNTVGEYTMATPAIADGTLYIRGHRHLFAIGNPQP